MLKQEYKENELNLKDALELAVKVFGKTLDTNKLTSEKGKVFTFGFSQTCVVVLQFKIHIKSEVAYVSQVDFIFVSVEMATLTRKDGKTCIRILPESEVDQFIKKVEEEEAKAEAEKKKKEAAGKS